MAEKSFSDIGVIKAIDELYGLSSYSRVENLEYRSPKGGAQVSAQRMFLEGIDFNLVYFPLKHLGYKCVVEATGIHATGTSVGYLRVCYINHATGGLNAVAAHVVDNR